MFPNRFPVDTCFISRANGLFVRVHQSPQLRSPRTKRGKTFVHRPESLTWTEGLHTMGCGLVPQPDRLQHCNLYPVPCSLQHNTFHLDMCRPEPRYPACVVVTIWVSYHTCYRVPRDPRWSTVWIHITLKYGQGFGFVGGNDIFSYLVLVWWWALVNVAVKLKVLQPQTVEKLCTVVTVIERWSVRVYLELWEKCIITL